MNCVVISDTHSQEKKIEWFKNKENIKKVDTIIHCGDFSYNESTFNSFLLWFSELDIKNKILISGNHDIIVRDMGYEAMKQICYALGIIYLQDSGVEIEGIKFWGSPWTPIFGDWVFMMDDFELDQHWQKISEDINVLITHGPPYGVGDYIFRDGKQDNHVGSRTLEMRIRKLKELKYVFSGHIHESCGKINISEDEKTTFYNASIMNFWFRPENEPWVFEIKDKYDKS